MLAEHEIDKLSDATYGAPSVVYLSDGRLVRSELVPDQHSEISDFDFYGGLKWQRNVNDHAVRPDGFDGNAEIIEKTWDQSLWWQPPIDVERNTPAYTTLRSLVVDILNYGFWGIVLELCDGEDAYGKPIVKHYASIWGLEPTVSVEDLKFIIQDLWSEIEGEFDE